MSFLLALCLSCFVNLNSVVLPGIEVLKKRDFDIVKGRNLGVIVNHTSVDLNGKHLVDLMIENGIKVKAIFVPEHGFWGDIEGGVFVENSTYRQMPVYSLYGRKLRPEEEWLKDIDTLVFDIQDVGARFYTYLTTMALAMEEASKRGIRFVVLDRPNPVSSYIIEGAILDESITAFTAYFKVPIRHSLTPGEMAMFYKRYSSLDLDLDVVRMEGYRRDLFFDETGLRWINTSPNIRNLNAAILYSGVGCFEATNVSVGRGTDAPFEFFGAPWLDNGAIVRELKKKKLKGVEFEKCQKIPKSDLYAGDVVNGVCIRITDKKKVRAFDIFVNALYFINLHHPDKLEVREAELAKMTGDKDFYELIKKGVKPERILKRYKAHHQRFERYLDKNKIRLY